jgi:hypothetical protein
VGIIEQTYAIVIAVESYASLGEAWNLEGVGEQAAEFVKWLTADRGVPVTNVQVFQSGAKIRSFTDLGVPMGQIVNATGDLINKFIANIGAHWPLGEILLIYWVGHGFVARDGGRRLIFGDAERNYKTNLDVGQLVQLLRSNLAGCFHRQIAFIDTCATFFEELQSSADLPPGGLNPGAPRQGIEQYFYFAASSGEYATKNAFGPRVLALLREVPAGEWPPAPRRLRDKIEDTFDRIAAERSVEQQPVWLEYREGDTTSTRGVLPTLADIHDLSLRAGFPVRQLRTLVELAAKCSRLAQRAGRDQLYGCIQTRRPLNRPVESISDTRLDLMRLIAGVIEQGEIDTLAKCIVEIEGNSDPAVRFERAAKSVEIMRYFWPFLVAIKIPFARALVLFKADRRLRAENYEPGSLEEILDLLIDLRVPEPFVEFLVRVARERRGDPNCDALQNALDQKVEWAPVLTKVNKRLVTESTAIRYLLLEIGKRDEIYRVTHSWLWSASGSAPRELDALDPKGDLASDVATLLNQAECEGGGLVSLELLVPDTFFHLERGRLAWRSRGSLIDPERRHPVALRWRDRMEARPRDPSYQTGRWKRVAESIRERLNPTGRAFWIARSLTCDEFCQKFDAGQFGELIGIPFASDGDDRDHLVEYVCNGGIPYACWPRCSTVDFPAAELSIQKLTVQYQFDDIPSILLQCRLEEASQTTNPLVDVILLWDDPRRNPYESKFGDVGQRG